MSNKSNSFMSFLVGAATGVVLGVLFAPDKGSNTRDRLSYKLDKYKVMLEELIEDIISDEESAVNMAKSKGDKVVNEAKEKAEQLLADVDSLIGHIKKEENEN